MRKAQLIYRSEPAGWWASSADLPGYTAAGASFEEVRALADEGAPWFAEQALELHHLVPGPQAGWSSPSVGQRARLELVLPAPRAGLSIQPSGLRPAA
jgi:predicted RNase H-like HicB family nuclease